MSHLPDPQLKMWKAGEGLSAQALNANFTAILGLLEVAMHTALSPDPASVGNEVTIAAHDQRIIALETLTAMHARQRNEREYTPLSYAASILHQVRELREPTEAAQRQLLAAHAEAQALHAGHQERLEALERQPRAATAAAHDGLAEAHWTLGETVLTTLAQVAGLRQEVAHLRRIAEGHDRIANRKEYAPMATVAHLLQRIMALEQRFPSNEGAS